MRPAHDMVAAYWGERHVSLSSQVPMLHQSKARRCLLPDTFLPSREAYLTLGFVIGRERSPDGLVSVLLPPGWTATDGALALVRDAKWRPRARGMFVAVVGGGPDGNVLAMVPRFEVATVTAGSDAGQRMGLGLGRVCVALTDAGRIVRTSEEFRADNVRRMRAETEDMRRWLAGRRPDASDPCAYWSDASGDL